MNQYTVTFDLPDGYQPGAFANNNGFFQVVNGVGRVTCPNISAYTSAPATTAPDGIKDQSGGGGTGLEEDPGNPTADPGVGGQR